MGGKRARVREAGVWLGWVKRPLALLKVLLRERLTATRGSQGLFPKRMLEVKDQDSWPARPLHSFKGQYRVGGTKTGARPEVSLE